MTDALITFTAKHLESYGLQKTVLVVLAVGVAISLVLYTFPPVFEALGDILSFEIRDAHARLGD